MVLPSASCNFTLTALMASFSASSFFRENALLSTKQQTDIVKGTWYRPKPS